VEHNRFGEKQHYWYTEAMKIKIRLKTAQIILAICVTMSAGVGGFLFFKIITAQSTGLDAEDNLSSQNSWQCGNDLIGDDGVSSLGRFCSRASSDTLRFFIPDYVPDGLFIHYDLASRQITNNVSSCDNVTNKCTVGSQADESFRVYFYKIGDFPQWNNYAFAIEERYNNNFAIGCSTSPSSPCGDAYETIGKIQIRDRISPSSGVSVPYDDSRDVFYAWWKVNNVNMSFVVGDSKLTYGGLGKIIDSMHGQDVGVAETTMTF
jgi:hypothetical protein